MPSTAPTKRQTSRKAPLKPTVKVAPVSTEQLAEKLATLVVSNSKGKQKAKVGLSAEEERAQSMHCVNSASQHLSSLVKSGWKSSEPKSTIYKSATESALSAAKHLEILRKQSPDDIDTERAAISVLGKLVALELYDHAFQALKATHPRINAFAGSAEQSAATSNHLLSLPIPTEPPADPILLNLISTYLINAIIVISHHFTNTSRSSATQASLTLQSFCSALTSTPTLLAWMPTLSALPAKHIDSLLTKSYTVINKLAQFNSKENPETVFRIRMYAIKCLAFISPGIIGSDSLWNQAIKFTSEYAKSKIASGAPSETESVNVILTSYNEMVTITEKRADRASFMSGKGFLNFCESWTSFANRAGDLESLDKIGAFIHSASMLSSASRQSSDTNPVPATSNGRHLDVEAANLYTTLAQVASVLGQEQAAIDDTVITRFNEWTSTVQQSPIVEILSQSTENKNLERIVGKVERALEKCRRGAIKILDQGDNASAFTNVTRKFVDVVIGVLEQTLRRMFRVEFVPQVLDALFVVARTTLSVSDPRTYTAAYDYLDRAVALLNVDGEQSESQNLDSANYARCISGAFHNLAGTLYQAGRYGSTIPFLKEGCRLGVKAMELRTLCGQVESGEQGVSKKDPWKQLEEQLWRRWQLLALCYTKIGDRKPAFDALLRCIEAFPYVESIFSDRVHREPMSTLFDYSPAVKELAGIVDRVSYIGACELLLPAEKFSLRCVDIASAGVKGALVERQLESLDAHRHKEGMTDIIPRLMMDAFSEYQALNMPIRCTRVYVRALSFAYYAGVEAIKAFGTPSEVGEKVQSLLNEDLGQDQRLSGFVPEYRAAIHLWLGLHAHRRQDPRQFSLLESHSEEACKYLQHLVDPQPLSPIASKSAKPSSASKKPPTRRLKPPKTRAKAPVTPKPRARAALQDIAVNTTTNAEEPAAATPRTLDSLQKLLEALQLCAHVLGLMALNLRKIRVLDIARKLSKHYVGMTDDGYIVSSSLLAREYLLLGKFHRSKKIFEHAQAAIQKNVCSEHTAVTFLLHFAELCAFNGDLPHGLELYAQAQKIASKIMDDAQSSVQKIQARVMRIERIAMAGHVLAMVSSIQNNTTASLKWLLQSLRLWNRAWEFFSRLQSTPSRAAKSAEDFNPFEVSSLRDALPVVTPQTTEPKKIYARKSSMSGLEWRIGQGLLQTMSTLAQTYFTRGSSREAQYFSEQARELAEALNAPAFVCRATTRVQEIQMYEGQLIDPTRLEALDALLERSTCVDTADVRRLRGDFEQRGARLVDAQQHYEAALRALEEFDGLFGKLDGIEFGPRHSLGSSHGTDLLTPTLLIRILREHIWLLRDEDDDRFDELLNRFLAIPSSLQSQAEKDALMAKLTLHDVYRRSRIDMFLSSIGETTVALPMGTSSTFAASLSPSLQEILRNLEDAEKLFWSQLLALGDTGYVPDVRSAIVSIALIRAFQASLGRSELESSRLMAGLLDASAAITLRREMLEVINLKFPLPVSQDDLSWPTVESDDVLVYRPRPRRQLSLESSDDEEVDMDESSLTKYWESVRQRYRSFMLDEETLSSPITNELPPHWTVVHITITDDRKTLFISRQRGGRETKDRPLMFCIPLQGRRESPDDDSEHQLTFEDAIEEFSDIIRLSNETTKVAASIRNDQAARAKWWKERGTLDTRLQELLENIEFCWLGAFKTILSKNTYLSQEGIANLRIQFDRVFQQGLRLQDRKTKEKALGHGKAPSESWGPNRVTLDDALVECFSTLSPECRNEELEDLVYFVLDLYQFHGVPVAIAEIDVDQVVVDLRTVLQEHAAKSKPTSQPRRPGAFGHQSSLSTTMVNEDEHLFLVLDKNIQGLPWESIPALRGRSVSRIPCTSFLIDRLHFTQWRREHEPSGSVKGKLSVSASTMIDRALVDPRQGYYIMNPSGDLRRTEERFKPWIKEMENVGWQGVSGRAPSELEVLRALEQNDLVVYFGHGGAEQYVRSHKIRHLRRCAAVMLWGCSSGFLKDMGDFDRIGTPLNYMLAGCPTLVANLWDVTDKDIDAFSQSVFDKLQLNADSIRVKRKGTTEAPLKETSVVEAVARSREVCKLKYLTGAAPVVYGIPYYL
ncbi:cysteine-type endopeptidase [Moniliophthora roreri MCA 2997]|uniref:separase n=1 Tax=Moniliophthora roreri (strain MCA 2997) TaxID=1381753 RepID=V2X3W8_MONRO|nr:cysteine-type endopeptidase [Moniliophthora roreri MCA 2997]